MNSQLFRYILLRYIPHTCQTYRHNKNQVNVFLEDLSLKNNDKNYDLLIIDEKNSQFWNEANSASAIFYMGKQVPNLENFTIKKIYYNKWVWKIFDYLPLKSVVINSISFHLTTLLISLINFTKILFQIKPSYLWILRKKIGIETEDRFQYSVVIPAYNEEKRISSYLSEILSFFKESKNNEIIVVDDGSTDRTVETIKKISKRIKIVRLFKNFGKGAAVQSGVLLAEGKKILIADADGSTPITELPKLEKELEFYDAIIGSRYMAQSEIIVKQPFSRRLISRIGNFIIKTITGLPYKDTQCGFKLFHKPTARLLFRDLRSKRFSFDIEVLIKAQFHKMKIKEVPVVWKDFTGSKVRKLDSLRVLWDVLKFRFQFISRFAVVGVFNTGIDFAIHNILIKIFGVGHPLNQVVYQSIGFIGANIFSFWMNSVYTFESKGDYKAFLSVSLMSLITANLTFFGMLELFNPGDKIILINAVKALSLAMSFIINYFGYKFLVFKVGS